MPGARAERAATHSIALLLCLVLLATTSQAAPAERRGVSGRVRNTVGSVVDGVEILVLATSSGVMPVASALSDERGRFVIPDLLPATYRIAALKEGYLTFFGQVDTQLDRWVDVVLRPAPRPDEPAAAWTPRDPTWVLRLPRRSVYRETEAVPAPAPSAEARQPSSSGPPLNLQVAQLFAVEAPLSRGTGTPAQLQGDETRLRMAGMLGQRGSIRLEGRREKLDSSWTGESGDGSANHAAARVAVDFAYDTSRDTRLDVRAFYDRRDLEWDAAAPGAPAAREQQLSWGYESAWSKQLDARSSLSVELDYSDHSFDLPQDAALSAPLLAGEFLPRRFGQRTITAGGSYEGLAAARHEFNVGFQASAFDSPLDTMAAAATGIVPGRTDPGWSVQVDAQDAWRLSDPLTLVCGLGYRRALTLSDTALLVPRLGGTLSIDRVVLRVMVSYHAVTRWDELAGGARPGWPAVVPSTTLRAARGAMPRPSAEIGYAAEVELPLNATLRLRGSTRYAPVQFDATGQLPWMPDADESVIFFTDGNAAVGATTLRLVHEDRSTRTYLELEHGQAAGLLAAALPTLLPQSLSQAQLTYANGRWGIRLIPSGTSVQLEYRKTLEGGAVDPRMSGIAEQERLELRVIQDLLRFQSLGNWRLLMAVRVESAQSGEPYDSPDPGEPATLQALSRGVRAGLSVTF